MDLVKREVIDARMNISQSAIRSRLAFFVMIYQTVIFSWKSCLPPAELSRK